MADEPNQITSTHEIAEGDWDGFSEPSDVETDMVATQKAEGKGIEFHVSMRDYTLRDMEELIVEAAARTLLGRHGDKQLSKLIEERVINLVTTKADHALECVAAEIIDQPMTPTFGSRDPVTMREFIGLTGREYLTQKVGSDGKATSTGYRSTPRLQYIVESWIERKFKNEIEKATRATISEVRNAIKAQHEKMLSDEKAKIFAAIKNATGEK